MRKHKYQKNQKYNLRIGKGIKPQNIMTGKLKKIAFVDQKSYINDFDKLTLIALLK